jgi:EAL domain-containing protein (putative c-di-GMP-specific phosphodiesterase class I)
MGESVPVGSDMLPLSGEPYEMVFKERILRALFERQFCICLHPKFRMPNRNAVGAEVLLRWNEPDSGIVFPREFIKKAEAVGLVEQLDIFALEEACKCIRSWLDERKPIVPLSINLSAHSLHSAHFLDAVSDCVLKYRIPASLIEFEFSAEWMENDFESLEKTIRALQDCGHLCAIDGFAGECVSLPLIARLRADTLKINCMQYAAANEPMLLNQCIEVVKEAKKLGLQTVLEGVEKPVQLIMLEQAGCSYMQGYALSMPVSIRLFDKMLTKFG